MSIRPRSVYIADDQPLSREGLLKIMSRSNLKVIGGHDKNSIIDVQADISDKLSKNIDIDLIVIDVAWRGDNDAGLQLLSWIQQKSPMTRVLIISNFQELLASARRNGAHATLYKDFTAREFVMTVNQVLDGTATSPTEPDDFDLTNKEKEVLALLIFTDNEIGSKLGISAFTVKKHVANILSKLGVQNRTSAYAKAAEHGLL